MPKKYSLKFWIIFWSISTIFLISFYFYLENKKNPGKITSTAFNYIPKDFFGISEYKALFSFADYFFKQDNQEKVFLLLFQNNMELRPGGGFIGTFGILKIKNGKVTEIQTHDLSNFDGRIKEVIVPPYPMKETLHINAWGLRDSNWSPDFSENAKQAEYLYHLGQGQENFDGVVAINTNVLESFLKITGPITLPDYPGTYNSENAILNLEYQVEKGYVDQGIEKGERKSIITELANAISEKLDSINESQKLELARAILEDLNNKDIQLYFKDENLEKKAREALWAGEVKTDWTKDYLTLVDANLGSFKSDYYIKRSFEYTINFSKEIPEANLKITYIHNGKEKDWMTKDYQTYLRIYAPKSAWLINSNGVGNVKFGEEFGKKYFGTLFTVPLNSSKTIEFNYTLGDLDAQNYDLLIQKQSGVFNLPGKITVIEKNGNKKNYDIILKNEWEMSENK